MANLYAIARNPSAVLYGIEGQPDVTVTVRSSRAAKVANGKRLINSVNEIVINATVGVQSCLNDKTCNQETLSARVRLSGSMQNATKRAALATILKTTLASIEGGFGKGESPVLPDTLTIDTELSTLYPTE